MTLADRLLVFELAGRRFALRVSDVLGVATPDAIRGVPGTPPMVLGLTEWRGQIVTVLDLASLLEIESAAGLRCLIRLAPPRQRVALLVPRPLEIRTLSPVEGRPLSEAAGDAGRSAPAELLDPEALVARVAHPAVEPVRGPLNGESRPEEPSARPPE